MAQEPEMYVADVTQACGRHPFGSHKFPTPPSCHL
jgi:hypothetical protein